ncbi:hypothetical protein VPFG_00231 [Vibrio phage nt-1]|uniref:Uncharacterized protein n=1 Tax=Vibrio phage nt-1 TaxID=115992 RepID=R9TIM0_9CAUD|nr:hypothetical protein VPFG_00231 [Vibrio phage nt-1]AGN30230.1 hypothetical protein VPFG_00231 [Vibrio phage nt-1]
MTNSDIQDIKDAAITVLERRKFDDWTCCQIAMLLPDDESIRIAALNYIESFRDAFIDTLGLPEHIASEAVNYTSFLDCIEIDTKGELSMEYLRESWLKFLIANVEKN